MSKAIEALALLDKNLNDGTACPLCRLCHDYLDEVQFFECVTGKNLCSKSEIVTKKLLFQILSEMPCD